MKTILVFGGTTEGRKSIEALEEAGNPFYYSTKTGEQDVSLHHGCRVDGAMDEEAMVEFCQSHEVGLLVDAAHPFAEVLHRTVAKVAERLHLPAIRFERIFPTRDKDIVWLNGYEEAVQRIREKTLLATTGVQSISKLKPLEAQGVRVTYRILPRESSLQSAHQQGATDDQLCFYRQDTTGEQEEPQNRRPRRRSTDVPDVGQPMSPTSVSGLRAEEDGEEGFEAILLKESGETGGFVEKVRAARERGMKIYAIQRPETPAIFHTVNGEHGLRLLVERLLPEFYPLHSGLTTGTCATAAAVAATTRLLKGEPPGEVPVILPNGETIHVPVGHGDGYACCIKAAGDDPDVTDGIEIRASVSVERELSEEERKRGRRAQGTDGRPEIPGSPDLQPIKILGGTGVGTFTLPGFDYPPGEPAINKAPRQMLRQNLQQFGTPLRVTLSVPQGEAIARKTFNPRLGITGGISIIGVSGIVKPFSEEAFIESIHKCMTVAKASGASRIVIHSGAKSEQALRALYPELPSQAFVEYGNSIGATLRIADELQVGRLTLGIMLGKAVKLAEGHLDTHSKKVVMNKAFIAQMLHEAGCDADTLARAEEMTLARELWDIIPPERLDDFRATVIRHCHQHCAPLLPDGHLDILLIQ